MTSYIPLYVDELIEAEQPPQRLIERIDRAFRLSPLWRLPHGRKSVEFQLMSRTEFPDEQWIERKLPINEVRRVLEVIKRGMEYPNDFFVPEDSMRLILTHGWNELAVEDLRFLLTREFKIDLTMEPGGEWWQPFYGKDDANVEAFVRYIISMPNNG